MIPYEVVWDPAFEDIIMRFLTILTHDERRSLNKAVIQVEKNLRWDTPKKSTPYREGFWRYEISPFRFVFELDEKARIVTLVQVVKIY